MLNRKCTSCSTSEPFWAILSTYKLISPIPTDSLCLQHAQMPRTQDLATFVPTTMTDRQTDYFTPCAYPRGNYYQTTIICMFPAWVYFSMVHAEKCHDSHRIIRYFGCLQHDKVKCYFFARLCPAPFQCVLCTCRSLLDGNQDIYLECDLLFWPVWLFTCLPHWPIEIWYMYMDTCGHLPTVVN